MNARALFPLLGFAVACNGLLGITDVTVVTDGGDAAHDGGASSDASADEGAREASGDASGDAIGDATGDATRDAARDGSDDAGVPCDGSACNAVVDIATTGTSSCVVLASGDVLCAGETQYGELGALPAASDPVCTDGPTSLHAHCTSTFTKVARLPPMTAIASGSAYGLCGIDRSGAVWCWGYNVDGELGHDPALDPMCPQLDGRPAVRCNATPAKVTAIPGRVKKLAGGTLSMLAVTEDGDLWAWGLNVSGSIGALNVPSYSTPHMIAFPNPRDVVDVGATIADDAVHGNTCALRASGSVWCMGANESGQLGHVPGDMGDVSCLTNQQCNAQPSAVMINATSPLANARGIAVNAGAACAVLASGDVWCWGANRYAVVKDPYDAVLRAYATKRVTVAITAILAGAWTSMLLRDGPGIVSMWGFNGQGALGRGDLNGSVCDNGTTCSGTIVPVSGLPPVAKISHGAGQAMVLTTIGEVWTWGSNIWGNLGHPPGLQGDTSCGFSSICNPTPAKVTGLP